MKDNYGKTVPRDLVVLDWFPGDFSDEEIQGITQAKWYESNDPEFAHWVLCSFKVCGLENDPIDYGFDLKKHGVSRIPHPLKRWSDEDGFYHA